jgi:hypothetical protein
MRARRGKGAVVARLLPDLRPALVFGVAVLVVAALMVRLAVPAGWMPRASGAGLMLCSGQSVAPPPAHAGMAGMHHAPDDEEAPQPCAFSAVYAATIAPADIPWVTPVLAIESVLSVRRPGTAPGRGLAAPPPPSHAPPHTLA